VGWVSLFAQPILRLPRNLNCNVQGTRHSKSGVTSRLDLNDAFNGDVNGFKVTTIVFAAAIGLLLSKLTAIIASK
jgi:hypothetical protein